MTTVAVIDIGSNTIKILVAQSGTPPVALHEETLDVRIGVGISKDHPSLTEEAIHAGAHAVAELLERAKKYKPTRTRIVATSAVRDARNRSLFAQAIKVATGLPLEILSGQEEAATLANALMCDPFLQICPDFCSIDLGGGSLEFLHYKNQKLVDSISLNIGSVRMTEAFVANPQLPLPEATLINISNKVSEIITSSPFNINDCYNAQLVGTGGAMSVTRAILAKQKGIEYTQHPQTLKITEIQKVLEDLASKPLTQRKKVPGLPPKRADIFPTALIILLTVAKLCNAGNFYHCPYNLRYGLAKELLDQQCKA